MKLEKTFKAFIKTGNESEAAKQDIVVLDKLEPGAYKFSYNPMEKSRTFIKFEPRSDSIIDLPSPEYTRVVSEMQSFLNPNIRQKFKDLGFLYKRSALLEGLPGTGKSVIVNRVMQNVVSNNGVCLFIEDPRYISLAYEVLNDTNPDTVVLTVLEEIDGMIDAFGDHVLLSILDGEIQRNNVMYLATTNYIDKVPKRILRPGRFNSVITVAYPNEEARHVYFEQKLGKIKNLSTLVEKTKNLSVDELKEIVQSCYIFDYNLDETIKRIKKVRGCEEPRSFGDSKQLTEEDFYD